MFRLPDGMTRVLRFAVDPDGMAHVLRFAIDPDRMTQTYGFPEAADRRGHLVLGFANIPAKGLLFCCCEFGRDGAGLTVPRREAVRRGHLVLRLANTPTKGNAQCA